MNKMESVQSRSRLPVGRRRNKVGPHGEVIDKAKMSGENNQKKSFLRRTKTKIKRYLKRGTTNTDIEEDDQAPDNWTYYPIKKNYPLTRLNLMPIDEYHNVDIGTQYERYFRGERVQYRNTHLDSFSHVVDLDAFEYHKIIFNSFLSEILKSVFFRGGILFLVLLNALLIGLNTNDDITREWALWLSTVDQCILGVFIFEILLKWMYDFRLFFKVTWNILDFIIVSLIILAAILPDFTNSKALVIVRVVRAFRSLRSVSSLTSLTIVTHTVVKSSIDMANILLVLLLFMTVLSIMGVILFDIEGIDTDLFITAIEAWYVLFVCVTQDGWVDFLTELSDQAYFWLVVLYIVIAVSVGGFVFANLIVAVVVANLEFSVTELKEEKQREENPLENRGRFSVTELDVLPMYEIFAKNCEPLRIQRPLKLANFKKVSERRLIAFIMIVVALEHNLLESSIINNDLERVMNVEINIVKQMQRLTPDRVRREKELGTKVLNDFNALGALGSKDVVLQRIALLEELNKLNKAYKKAHSAEAEALSQEKQTE